MPAPVLRLKNVIKAYEDHVVLNIPDLQLGYGTYWLLGGNGAGKTTCMKVMAALIPSQGEISVDNVQAKQQPVQFRRLVNYAEAEPVYPGFLTGKDLLHLYLKTKGKGYKDLDQIIHLLGIQEFFHRPVSGYSSGMLKKLSLVLAFTGTPKVILLDEPLITLDVQTVPLINNLVEEFHTQFGITFIISSHQPVSGSSIRLQVQDKNIVAAHGLI
ncbi:ABC transporter ATP-binding protein [Chitinophaga sancti]|uniref:ABC transporter ATP-binding protein n=1 Tax=Chitinophaga sancti TaxID=1004 RepID=A0A1K1PVE5_9BACT|nr:ABC transporter ATP-binding protein [Chitinophaga sancti]WQD61670.1 ABC transporter ATP-binding protein [Chitinophaga sancti]WQG92773.1 ABC transporter ATP-binding protein [Chitinophaga sancti]SFW50790.1 ABC-2 type transport system ATP-binding protein [Chitinophaga sancti]